MMDWRKITRREFLRIVGSSSLFMTLPLSGGCLNVRDYAVSMVKDADDAYSIRRALDLIGGLDFLKPGDSVLLKLALNSPNSFPATTSPTMVTEVIKLLKERGAGDIWVGDKSPVWRDTMDCMEKTGLYQAAVDAGAETVEFKDDDMVHVQPGHALHWPGGFFIPTRQGYW